MTLTVEYVTISDFLWIQPTYSVSMCLCKSIPVCIWRSEPWMVHCMLEVVTAML